MLKTYAQFLILIMLLPHCAGQAYSMFSVPVQGPDLPVSADHDPGCHETGSDAPAPSAPEHPDCCVRPQAGQVEKTITAVAAGTVFVVAPPVYLPPLVFSDQADNGDLFAQDRHRNDLTGVIMRN